MGLFTAVVAGFLAIGAYVTGEKGRKQSDRQFQQASAEQRKARSEDQALQSQRAAVERRQQVREERIARGRLLQASENTGADGSSGERGAQAGLATQLGANIGFNLGQIAGQGRANQFNQNAADFNTAAQKTLSDAQGKAAGFSLASSLFSNAGSFKAK